uniref:Uncharacterized protein n=1 Tax=Setaria viridis TaxID=4556 RepID=A0A4U6TZR4_SETVI|nr:hypothetical protein SEVIR_6G034300v2 [Setaria viridis]
MCKGALRQFCIRHPTTRSEGRGSSCWLRRRTATRQLGRQHQHPTLCMNWTRCQILADRDAEALSSIVTSAFAREST